MAVRLLLVREAETAWEAQGRLRGQTPLPALPDCLEALGEAVPELAAQRPEAIYAPPRDPGRATGTFLRRALDLPLWKREALLPLDTGAWEGLALPEIETRYGRIWRQVQAAPAHYGPPRGETLLDVADRLQPLVEDLVLQEETAVVVAQREVLLALMAYVSPGVADEEEEPDDVWQLWDDRQLWTEFDIVTGED
jgi:probable phosphoglycerate mutase